jgi:opacity protein-like surface antigen
MVRFRASLLAGVSACALFAVAPVHAQPGDLPSRPALFAQAPAAVQHKWIWWIEGGPSYLSGDTTYIPGFTNPPFGVSANGWGGEVGAGVDYRFDTVWHLSAQFRYGWYGPRYKSSNPVASFIIPTDEVSATIPWPGNNTANRNEEHWLADFMIGRDLGLGQGLPVVGKFGVRIAEIRGKTEGTAVWYVPNGTGTPTLNACRAAPPPGFCTTHRRDYAQWNSFFGVGPRFEFDGAIPLAPRWTVQVMGGAGALYGRRKAANSVAVSQGGATVTYLGGGPIDAAASDRAWVFNCDAMLGLSYAITANYSLMLSYRFDGYWNALKGFDQNGQPVDLDRFYQGVMLRVTFNN